MTGTVKRLLISASLLAGISAIAPNAAQASVLTLDSNSINFNTTDYNTYSGGSNGNFLLNNLAAARTALTDADPTSNVELWYSTENPTANVGFSGTLGGHNVSVSSVTAADWSVFGSQWLNGLLTSNVEIQALWNALPATAPANQISKASALTALTTVGLPSSGDPNIGAFTLDTDTNKFSLDLLGHFDLKDRIKNGQYKTGNQLWDNFLFGAANKINGPIQASEIAKVTIDGQTYYAYSFNPTATGIVASAQDESYNGKYTWTVASKPVPEPSAMLGLMALGGFFAAKRKLGKNA